MATVSRTRKTREVDYPTSDGKPMAETDIHRDDMIDVIEVLKDHFADRPDVYVTGNLLLFYEEGNRRKHVSPDVFVVRGIPKLPPRDYYLLWKEEKAPEVVIEITSKTTRREDQIKKLSLYRDLLKVAEYFQFDPTEDYLKPPFQGHRLVDGEYERIIPIDGRLPSEVLGLHLQREGTELRFYNPMTRRLLSTRKEVIDTQRAAFNAQQAAIEAQQAALAAQQAAIHARDAAIEAQQAAIHAKDAENERLRLENEELRRLLRN
jgi:Uma2 family endonuclease